MFFIYNLFMFKRPLNIIITKIMDKKYKNIINQYNLESISFFKFKKIFKDEDKLWKESYIHNLINKWFLNQKENEITFKKLKWIIFKSRIQLNQIEKHNLFLIEERIFSIDRHIKILEVNEKLFAKEKVGAKFTNAKFFLNKELLIKLDDGNLNITNFRIMFITKQKIKYFNWNKIYNVKHEKYGFCFSFKNENFVIRIHDQITLNNTIKNLYRKINKKWLV